MTFIDEMDVHMKAGKGGDGVVRWLHEKFKEFGGPAGGNGGRGGDVYVKAVRDTWILARYKNIKEFTAEDGEPGGGRSMHGANGKDLVFEIPAGSVVTNKDTGEVYRLDKEGDKILILKGGNGGLGNEYFKSSTNQTPKEHTPGKPAESADFRIEVEIIADAGLIGLPNAGKTSLLNALTRAEGKVGAYQFTTLEPNLGDLYGFILADIPGLIEGASEGKGLGHKFLRHIKRTKCLLHCVSLENYLSNDGGGIDAMVSTYETVKKELQNFDQDLAEKKEFLIITKSDLLDPETSQKIAKEFTAKIGIQDYDLVSIYDLDEMKKLSNDLVKKLN